MAYARRPLEESHSACSFPNSPKMRGATDCSPKLFENCSRLLSLKSIFLLFCSYLPLHSSPGNDENSCLLLVC